MTPPLDRSAANLASRGRRFAALALDAAVVPLVTFVLVFVTGAIEHAADYQPGRLAGSLVLLAVAAYLLVNGWFMHSRGQTLGKAAFGIAVVVEATHEVAGFGRQFLRALFFPLIYLVVVPSLLVLPLLDAVFVLRRDRRCLHDLVCGTRVVAFEGRIETAAAG